MAATNVEDRGENVASMEPLLISESCRDRPALVDLTVDLAQKSTGLRSKLPPSIVASLATLVREMNCYYSNLIEGHNTHPIDIERALKGEYSQDTGKRNLQLEARAHIAVQQWIDSGGLSREEITSMPDIVEIHRRFCAHLPDDLLRISDPSTGEEIRVVPGELRERDVKIGQHVAISPGAVPRFLARFSEAYSRRGKVETILSAATAHHRLLWIHPFLDGNGRVARLMSHAILLYVLDTGAIWSVARGLARNVQDYKSLLANCDLPRRNDLDGRGTLSEEALVAFVRFFLRICIDQVDFMERLIQPELLRVRIVRWAAEQNQLGKLPAKAGAVLEAVLYRGELPRSEVESITQTTDRQARRVVAALAKEGVLTSDTPYSPLRLAFPAVMAAHWLPGLFPEQPD